MRFSGAVVSFNELGVCVCAWLLVGWLRGNIKQADKQASMHDCLLTAGK